MGGIGRPAEVGAFAGGIIFLSAAPFCIYLETFSLIYVALGKTMVYLSISV